MYRFTNLLSESECGEDTDLFKISRGLLTEAFDVSGKRDRGTASFPLTAENVLKSLLEETGVFKNISLLIYKIILVKNENKQTLVDSSE